MKLNPVPLALISFVCFCEAPALAAQTQNQPSAMPMGQMAEMHKPAPTAGPLKITFGDKSATWTPAQLAAMPQTSVTVYNEHTKATETYTGVPVIDLLTQVGVPATPRGKDLRLYLVAVGSDDYEAVYAVAEVNPSLHDATVIVADTENGKPLAGDGPLKLVDTREKRPARWVRNLVAIHVLAAE
jgi:hypothetical protein